MQIFKTLESLFREAADEIFKVHEILRPKKTIYIIPYAFKCEMDVNVS